MPIINPDTSEATGLEPIEGTRKSRITAVETGNSKAGNPQIIVTFEVDVDGQTRTRKGYLPITGNGAFGFDQLLRATGFGEVADRLKAKEKVPFNTDDLVGQELNLVFGPDTYNGQVRDKINSYLKV